MPIKQKILRSSVAGDRPVGFEEGESYINYADLQFGVVNPGATARDLVAVRFFSTTAVYVLNDLVVNEADNLMYQCTTPTGPGAFNAPDWTLFGTGSGGTPGGADTDIQFNDGGVFGGQTGFTFTKATGVQEVPRLHIGDLGTEDGGIIINGTLYNANLKTSVINSTDIAQFVMHRHSTTFPPVLVTSRSMTNDATHLPVADGDELFRMLTTGWNGTDYSPAAEIRTVVDGTVSATAMPGRIEFITTAAGQVSGTVRMTLDSAGDLNHGGNIIMTSGDPTIDLVSAAGTASIRLAGGGADPGIGSFDFSHDGTLALIQAQGNQAVLQVGTNGGSYMLMYDNGHLSQPGNFSLLTTDDEDVIFWDESVGELQIITGAAASKALAATFNANGDLILEPNANFESNTSGQFGLKFATTDEWAFRATRNSGVELFEDNSVKLTTVSDGVNVTGDLRTSADIERTGSGTMNIRHLQSSQFIDIVTENSGGAARTCGRFGGATPGAIFYYDAVEKFRTYADGAYASGQFAINPGGLNDDVILEFWQGAVAQSSIVHEDLGDVLRISNLNVGTIVHEINSSVVMSMAAASITANQALLTSASTATRAGFNIAPGVAPTTPVNGDHWITGAAYNVRLNGVTVDLAGGGGGGLFSETGTGIASNIIGGANAGASLTTGTANFLGGYNAGTALSNGGSDVAIGWDALSRAISGSSCVAIGPTAGRAITSGDGNIAIGATAMNSAGASLVGDDNIAIGNGAMGGILTGANDNIGIGNAALFGLTSGDGNVSIGWNSGVNISSGINNIILGISAGPTTNQSNKLYINNAVSDTPLIFGDFTAGEVVINGILEIEENSRINLGNGNERIQWSNAGSGSIDFYQDSQVVLSLSGSNNVTMSWGDLHVGSTSASNGLITIQSSAITSSILDFYVGTGKVSEIRQNVSTGDLEIRTQVAGRDVVLFSDLGFEGIRVTGTNGDVRYGGYMTLYNGVAPADGTVLKWVTANGRAEFSTSSGVPGGITGDIQFNNAGAFDGSSDFSYDGTTVGLLGTINIDNSTSLEALNINQSGAGQMAYMYSDVASSTPLLTVENDNVSGSGTALEVLLAGAGYGLDIAGANCLGIRLAANAPTIWITEMDAAVDQGNWIFGATSGAWSLLAGDDALTNFYAYMTATRSGTGAGVQVDAITLNAANTISLGNYVFQADQTVGAGQDNFVLTYDNGTGEISLEAAGGGIGGSITDNQIAFGATTANDIEGSAELTWNGSFLTIGDDTDASAGLVFASTAAGSPFINFNQNTATKAFAQYQNGTGFVLDSDDNIILTVGTIAQLTISTGAAVFRSGIDLQNSGTIRTIERADHAYTPTATFGELWVKNTVPNTLIFTDDAGTDWTLNTAGGGIGGSITDNQIAVGATTADDIEGSAELTYDAATNKLTVGQSGAYGHIATPATSSYLILGPEPTNGAGPHLIMYGTGVAVIGGDFALKDGTANRIYYDDSASSIAFTPGANDPFTIDNDGTYFGHRISEHSLTNTNAVDLRTGSYFYRTYTSASTLTFTNPDSRSGAVTSFTMELTNASTNITWPTSVKWPGGTEPTWSTTGVDIVSFISRDNGTTWYGFLGGLAFA